MLLNGTRWPRGAVAVAVILALTVVQLAVGAFVPGLTQFEGKGFGARLPGYIAMMLAVPVVWWLVRRRRGGTEPLPWAAFAWIMLPFLIDVTGNTLDLYDTVWWWDDANHLVNWFFLNLGIGLLLERGDIRPRWALAALIAGIGAILAIIWELGEWTIFIRFGTELATAYQDTLGDLTLGTLGATIAGIVVARRRREPGFTSAAGD